MDDLLEGLKEKYKLSKEFEHVQERLIKRATEKVTTTNNPIVIIIGGQPGAGKTQLQLSAEKTQNIMQKFQRLIAIFGL
ncbi:MAG: zeta toxin family protein [Ginsengibacter sp.]